MLFHSTLLTLGSPSAGQLLLFIKFCRLLKLSLFLSSRAIIMDGDRLAELGIDILL